MATECSVCLANVDPADDFCRTECGHVFHSQCIFRALASDTRCPMCRTELVAPQEAQDEEQRVAQERAALAARQQRNYHSRRRRLEANDVTLEDARERWLAAEESYNNLDASLEAVIREVMHRFLATREIEGVKKRRTAARRYAQRLKSRYKYMLAEALGDPPDGLLDSLLRRRRPAQRRGSRLAFRDDEAVDDEAGEVAVDEADEEAGEEAYAEADGAEQAGEAP